MVALKSIDGSSREKIALPLMNSQRSSPCEKKLRHEAERALRIHIYIYVHTYRYMYTRKRARERLSHVYERELPTTPSYFSIHPVLKNPFLHLLLCWLLLFLLLLSAYTFYFPLCLTLCRACQLPASFKTHYYCIVILAAQRRHIEGLSRKCVAYSALHYSSED